MAVGASWGTFYPFPAAEKGPYGLPYAYSGSTGPLVCFSGWSYGMAWSHGVPKAIGQLIAGSVRQVLAFWQDEPWIAHAR